MFLCGEVYTFILPHLGIFIPPLTLLLYPKLPAQDELKERGHFIVLDKLVKEKKTDRCVHIFARSIQMLDEKGRILKRLTKEDEETVRMLLGKEIKTLKSIQPMAE